MASTPFLFRPSSSFSSMENNQLTINNTSPPAKEEVINGDEDMIKSSCETVLKHKRKNGKVNQQKKKEPQRGLGVAQLERLRLADRIKALQDMGIYQAQQQQQQHVPFQYQQYPLTYRGGSFSPTNYGVQGHDFGFSTPYTRISHGGGYGFSDTAGYERKPVVLPVQLPFEEQGPHMNYGEPAKELSSIQMMHCLSDNCYFCSKKRQMMVEENEGKPKMEMDGYGSLGLRLGVNNSHNGDMEEVEVMAVHRKSKAVIGGGSVLMEYKFFPACNNSTMGNSCSSSSSNNNTDSSEASATTPPTHAQFLDLSLKLSC